ncbi:response regulator transcription factor [Arthrobacter sp. 4R501]|uniref:response regulator transcription factor n=1 Tax=Arthrobacter sp. 4R501 TaxID=2058886 RepID=UPI000CE57A87|nr:response regulator [Arthrobacter sp. 4R501]
MKSRGVVLVIEDDQDIRSLICVILTQMGFDVHAVASGAEGLAAARTLHPVLVTLDLGLPDIDGHEVAHRIRDLSEAPMLFVTAHAEPDDEMASMASGAAAYLTKPFRPKQLMELADMLCPAEGTAPVLLTP